MTLLLNLLNGTDGSTISNGNSALPDAFTGVTSTPVYDDDVLLDGSWSMFIANGSAARNAYWTFGSDQSALSISFLFRASAIPPAVTVQLVQGRDASSGRVFTLGLTLTNGRIVLQNSSDSIHSGTNIAGHAISANTTYQVDLTIQYGTGTTDGVCSYSIYSLASGWTGTPITGTWSDTDVLIDNPIRTLYFGPNGTGDRAADWWFGRLRVNTGSTTPLGEYSPPPPDITESLTDNLALLEADDGTPPFTLTRDSGPTVTVITLDDGAVSGTGQWLVPKHATDTGYYTVTDDEAVESDPYTVPPISPANTQLMRPDGVTDPPPGNTWL